MVLGRCHSLLGRSVLSGTGMRRMASIFSALMLILMLWTGTTAHAAELLECVPVGTEMVGHFDGDEDQVPSGSETGVAHHHTGCSGHSLAAPAGETELKPAAAGASFLRPCAASGLYGHGPDNQLRPPIA